jgi:anti-sigma factor RsiW
MSANDGSERDEADEESHDPRLTELVAYLDGELEADQSARLERQFAVDAPLRRYAESLDRTWQLLDTLGDAPASGEFTQRTLASISAMAIPADTSSAAPKSAFTALRTFPYLKVILWTALGFIACFGGLKFARTQSRGSDSADARILRELPLYRDLETLNSIRSTEFLRKVAAAVTTDPPQEPEE